MELNARIDAWARSETDRPHPTENRVVELPHRGHPLLRFPEIPEMLVQSLVQELEGLLAFPYLKRRVERILGPVLGNRLGDFKFVALSILETSEPVESCIARFSGVPAPPRRLLPRLVLPRPPATFAVVEVLR